MSQTKVEKKSVDKSGEQKTYAKGLEGVVAAQTTLSLVDGKASQLYYRGIPVHEFVDSSNYEEVVFLLWNGKLPTRTELDAFKKSFIENRPVPEEILSIIKHFPKKAHPMGVLRSAVSTLGLYDPEGDAVDVASTRKKALKLTAAIPTLIAAHYRIRKGLEIIAPKKDGSHAENFYFMMHGKDPEPEMAKALDAYLILLADHGLNASTFSSRVTTSTQSDIYSAITAGIGTLKGDLHGSANQRAMEMILEIGDPEKAESYIKNLLAQKAKVMGFGHRIYKKEDPRAVAFRAIAKRMCERSGERKWMDISDRVEKVMWDEKQIPCNVDFFSASVLYILGFPVDFFTTVFAASRVAGWSAHVLEQLQDNRLIRPAALYTGPKNEHYVPIDQRS